MTTETGKIRRIIRPVLILTGLVGFWFSAMVVAMFTLDVSRNALVFGSPTQILAGTSQDIKLLRTSRKSMVVTSSRQGYVRELYAAGAWIVLPSLNAGCLALPKSATG